MDRGQAFAAAVDVVATALNGGTELPNSVRCMCVWCLEELDRGQNIQPRRAPDDSECWRCGSPERQRDGMVYVIVERQSGRIVA